MAVNVNFTVPDTETAQRIATAFVNTFSIPTDAENNPIMSENAWVKDRIKAYVKSIVVRYERRLAEQQIAIDTDGIIDEA